MQSNECEGVYCPVHAWANTFKPFWDDGSTLSGSLIHRTVAQRQSVAKEPDE